MMRIATIALLSLVASVCLGQGQAAAYQQAAQVFLTQAAACQNPAGAACMRLNARYYQCLAAQLGPGGPASCSAPTCSTSCVGSGGGAGLAGAAGSTGANKLVNAVGTGMQIYQLGKAFGLFGSNNSQPEAPADTGPTPEQLAAQQAAAQAAQQQQINADAANILSEANAMAGTANAPDGIPSSTSQVTSLLDDGSAPPDATTAVNTLLGNSTDPNAATTNAVTNLLGSPTSASGNTPSTQSLSTCVANNMTNIQACLPSNANLPAMPPTQQTLTSDGQQELLDFPGDGTVTVVKYPSLGSPVSETYNNDGSGTTTYPNGVTVTNNSDGTMTYPANAPQPTVTTYNKDGSVTHSTPTVNSDGSLTYPKLPSAVPPKSNP
ncbi:MAG: hypothetical protein ABR976_14575 [Terracidiphilus sp.]|jgi:hypothetical protein